MVSSKLTPLEQLGKLLFFDTNLSTPPGQSCATCHAPEVGFTGPDSEINAHGATYPGAVPDRFGNRKPSSAAYASGSPILFHNKVEEVWTGGMFWNGRATGWTLGDPLAEQAQVPFLNPLEQNLADPADVCRKVADSAYADFFETVWGPGSLDWEQDVEGTYARIGLAISAYQQSSEVNPFASKYDYYLAGTVALTEQESWGLALFNDPEKGNCAACHPSDPGPAGEPPVFTDFTYDNLGLPRNPENRFYALSEEWNPKGNTWIDQGLGGFLADVGYGPDVSGPEMGKHKVPTLRNVDLRPSDDFVKAFGHNGVFHSLEEFVNFYNTRDVKGWPPPEVPENVNTEELGNLGLTAEEEAAIVAFMKTLSDGYQPDP
jgi:cytochrome c peroxidase